MRRTNVIPGCCLIVALFPGSLIGLSSDQPLRAGIQHARATSRTADDPDLTAVTLTYALRLTNRSEKTIYVPILRNTGVEIMSVLGVQARQAEGPWVHLMQGSWYDAGNIRYVSCQTLSPGQTAEIGSASATLLLLKNQFSNLGARPTLRLNLMFYCRVPDGEVRFNWAETDAFALQLPAQH